MEVPADTRRKIFDYLLNYPSRVMPYWIQVMGIPGAGKTELVQLLKEELAFRKPYTLAAFDVFMEQIPEYRAMPDRQKAFKVFEEPARDFGFEVLTRLIAQKTDVVFEHGLTYLPARDLLVSVKKAGYQLICVRIVVDAAIAKERVKRRDEETGRHVPESLIDERLLVSEDRWSFVKEFADYTVVVKNNGEVSVYNAFKDTVTLVSEYVRKLADDKAR
jgi:predicted ABC-type ATPase